MNKTKEKQPRQGGGLIDTLADWLMSQALGETDMETLIDGCCNRLAAAGIPLSRAYLAFRTLHPLFAGFGYTWQRGQGVTMESYSFDQQGDEYRRSPVHHMETTGIPYLRRRLTGAEALLDFPMLEGLMKRGATDYMGYLVPFSADDGIIGSWASDRLAFGVALHVGEVVYGNIGLPERLELTVVGAATNEASRLQGLTKELARPVLVSDGFAQNLNLDWEPMGKHELRGVAAPQAVFAPPG